MSTHIHVRDISHAIHGVCTLWFTYDSMLLLCAQFTVGIPHPTNHMPPNFREFFYIGIQCYHPFLYWVACAFSSFVFTFFMYSLTVAFGNIGEALGIVLLVIQVAGSGGTFPIEVLPNAYQIIYRFLLFPYSMDALRECIAGMYRYDYIKNLAFLSIYIVVSLIIGLFLQKPFEKLNHMIERSKEKSGVML